MSKLSYRADIDGLRAIAVLCVMFFHVGFSSFKGGYVGVDVFFVISGYLITKLIRDEVIATGRFSFTNFYIRRTRRLLPALFAVLFVSFITSFIVSSPAHFERLGASLVFAIYSLSNLFFWHESGYFDAIATTKPLLHTWSLGIEEQFYLVWPMILVFALLKTKKWVIPLIIFSAIFSFFLNFIFQDGQSRTLSAFFPDAALWFVDGKATLFYLAPFRVFEFAIGAILVWVTPDKPVHGLIMDLFVFAGLAMILYSVFTYTDKIIFPYYNALLPCLGAALLIYSGTSKYTGVLLRNPVLKNLGLISYSLYLVHWPLLVFYAYLKQDELSLNEQIILSVSSILLAGLVYHYVEQPFRYSSNRKMMPNKQFGLVIISTATVLTLLSSSVWQEDGWGWRLGENFESARLVSSYGGAGCAPHLCTTQDNNREIDVYMIGDSHSRAYFEGFKQEMSDLNIAFIEASGCYFFSYEYTRKYMADAKSDRACKKARSQAFDLVSKHRKLVVITHNWGPVAMISETTGNEHKREEYDNYIDYIDFVSEEMGLLVEKLNIEKLIILGNVPTTASQLSPLDCMARPLTRNEHCSSTSKNNYVIQTRQKYNAYFLQKTKAIGVFIDPYEFLCDSGSCSNINNSLPLYYDETHLSKWGSIFMARKIKPVINAALGVQ